MSETATLKIEVRKDVSKTENKRLLHNGYIIGVINGKGSEAIPVAVKKDEFRKALKENGRTSILKLKGPGRKSYNVMIKSIQVSPLKYEYHHVDFQQVSLTEEVRMEVAIKFAGTEYLSSNRLILNKQMDTLTVIGLPQNIPSAIEIDVSRHGAGDNILVEDLPLGAEITTDIDPTHLVASIGEAKIMSEEKPAEDNMVVESKVDLGNSERDNAE